MKIVVLDGFTLNPGDLSWAALEALGDCVVYDRTVRGLVVDRAREAEVVFTNKVVLGRAEFALLPKLRYIGVLATGYNVVDVAAARERGIVVTNIPAYGTRSVAQMTFSLILELAQHVGHHAQTVCDGRWSDSKDFCYWDYPLVELEGLTLGLIGFGRIGQAVAKIAKSFGMKTVSYNKQMKELKETDVKLIDMDTLFRESDIVSLHCPLTAENKGFINRTRLEMMKPSAFLINTSRGPLINEPDLAYALNTGRISGAGLDVLAVEPPLPDNPLLKAKNCLITPHISWATTAARRRLMDTAAYNLSTFIADKPENVVNQ
jgi:glycerate dehydrogenase